jgi:hypothetical protein
MNRNATQPQRDCSGPLGDCLESKLDVMEIVEEPLFNQNDNRRRNQTRL